MHTHTITVQLNATHNLNQVYRRGGKCIFMYISKFRKVDLKGCLLCLRCTFLVVVDRRGCSMYIEEMTVSFRRAPKTLLAPLHQPCSC